MVWSAPFGILVTTKPSTNASGFRRVQPLDVLVEDRVVENGEEVPLVLVVVDLRSLALRDDVLDVERVPAETPGDLLGRLQVGETTLTQVEPGERAHGHRRRQDDRRAANGRANDRTCEEARHGYSVGRPSSAPCSRSRARRCLATGAQALAAHPAASVGH